MATLPTLVPEGDGSFSGTTLVGSSLYWSALSTNDGDTSYVSSGVDSSGTLFVLMSDVPADFASLDSLFLNIAYRLAGTLNDDTMTLHAQVFDAAESTALTNEVLVASAATANSTSYASNFYNFTTVVLRTDRTAWNGARLRLRWTFSKSKGSDGIALRVTSASLGGTYTQGEPPPPPPREPRTRVENTVVGTGLHQFDYQGTGWGSTTNRDGFHFTNTTGDAYEFDFSGTGVEAWSPLASDCGIVAFSIDGGAEVLVDTYAPVSQPDLPSLAWSIDGLPDATHTLRARCTGTKRAESTSTYLANAHAIVLFTEGSTDPASPLLGAGALAPGESRVAGAGRVVLRGSGAVGAPRAAVAGSGVLRLPGSGSLVAPDVGAAAGGLVLVRGAGALDPPPPVLRGAGSFGLQPDSGRGALVAPRPVVSGSGTLRMVGGGGSLLARKGEVAGSGSLVTRGAGALQPAAVALAAAGLVRLRGAGALTAPDGDVDAVAALLARGQAVLVAGSPEVLGSGVLRVLGAGALLPAKAYVDGTGSQGSADNGRGALVAPRAVVAGSGVLRLPGSGALAPSAAAVQAAARVVARGAGAATAGVPTAAGSGSLRLHGSGALAAAVARVAGSGALLLRGAGALQPAAVVLRGGGTTRVGSLRVEWREGFATLLVPGAYATLAPAPGAYATLAPAPGQYATLTDDRSLATLDYPEGDAVLVPTPGAYATMDPAPGLATLDYAPGLATIDSEGTP